MPVFSYRAYQRSGKIETGLIEADSLRDASQRLLQADKRPFAVDEVSTKGWALHRLLMRRGTRSERSIDFVKLFSELSVLLDAGFTPLAALRILISAESSPKARAKLSIIADELSNGRSFSQAFASLAGLPVEVRPMLASGESSGNISEVIAKLAESYRYRAQQRAAMLEALTYPAFLIVMLIGAVLFLALFLMPTIEPLFETNRANMPTTVALFSALGRLLNERWIFFLAATMATGAISFALIRSSTGRRSFWRIIQRVPVIGRVVRETAIIRYLQTLSLLTENSVPLIEALKLAAETCAIPDMHQRLDGIREAVAGGERFNAACSQSGVFDNPTITLIEIGEEANRLATVLRQASALLDTRLKRSTSRLLTFLTPAITVLMGVLVGGLVISVMTALLSINEVALH